jgi:hypothetical protein
MKTLIALSIILLFVIILFSNSSYKYDNIRKAPSSNPNRVIKSTYDVKHNIYAVLYIENNDTVGLDWIHPYELDSLINYLNKENGNTRTHF